MDQGKFPLFVAEGEAKTKLEQIRRNGYLSYCYGKLARIKGPLVTFGFSFGGSDEHICDAIIENTDLNELFIGIFGDPEAPFNSSLFASVDQMLQRRSKLNAKLGDKQREKRKLTVTFFASETAKVWG